MWDSGCSTLDMANKDDSRAPNVRAWISSQETRDFITRFRPAFFFLLTSWRRSSIPPLPLHFSGLNWVIIVSRVSWDNAQPKRDKALA